MVRQLKTCIFSWETENPMRAQTYAVTIYKILRDTTHDINHL